MQCCMLKQRTVTVLSLYLQSASPCPRKTGMEARDLGRVRLHNGYKIKQLVEDPYGDAVYWNGSFYTLDYFMRNVGNAKVYFGNVLYMN